MKTGVLWRDASPEELARDEWGRPPFPLISVPSAELREASGVSDPHLWYVIGDCWAQLVSLHLPWGHARIVDIGCSCGKIARFLSYDARVRYLGLDVFRPSIEWCERAFIELPRFRFKHIDVVSELYNPAGTIAAQEAVIPVEDHSADVVVAASLFTHSLDAAFFNYLSEIARCLKVNGRALIGLRLDPSIDTMIGDESDIRISPRYFAALVAECGLRETRQIENVFGQTVSILMRR